MKKDSQISSKFLSVKLSNSTGDEQEIRTSEETDGILKQSNRIFTGQVSLTFPNLGIFCVPIVKKAFPKFLISKSPVRSTKDSTEPVSSHSSFQWKLERGEQQNKHTHAKDTPILST